jgi:hypothetical protein
MRRAIQVINRVTMWLLIVVPVTRSGLDSLREQLGYGVGQPWNSWSDVIFGWGFWLVAIAVWIAVVRGASDWIDRKLRKLTTGSHSPLSGGR